MKLTKAFRGVKAGEIYPTEFQAGDEVPPELEAGAIAAGAVKAQAVPRAKKGNDGDNATLSEGGAKVDPPLDVVQLEDGAPGAGDPV